MSADWPYGGPARGFGGRPVPAGAPYGGQPLQRAGSTTGAAWGYGAPPVAPPPPKRRRRRAVVASGIGLALVATAVVAWPKSAASTTPVGQVKPGGSPSASSPAASGPAGISDTEILALFDRRSVALTSGNLSAWLADVDPAQKLVLAQQKQLFAGLRQLPLASYAVKFGTAGEHDHFVAQAFQTTATRTRSPGLRILYQLRGYDPAPVARAYVPIIAEHDGKLLIEGDQTAKADPESPLEPWESGPIAVASGKHVLVVVSAKDKSRLAGLVTRSDAAVGWVSSMWPKVGTGRAVLYALRDQKVLDRYEIHASAVSEFDGVTVGAYDPAGFPKTEGTRVLFNPKYVTPASSTATLNDLLRHEFTHVAHWNDTHLGTPTWAIEGIAEYTSFRAHRSDQRVSGDIGKAARAGKLPKFLPRSKGFYDDARGVHYGISWLTFQYVSETYGETKLRKLYNGMAAIDSAEDSKAALTAENTVFVKTLGTSEAAFVKKLSSWTAKVLRPV